MITPLAANAGLQLQKSNPHPGELCGKGSIELYERIHNLGKIEQC